MILTSVFLVGVAAGIVIMQLIRRRGPQQNDRVTGALRRWRVIDQLDAERRPEQLARALITLGAEELRVVARPNRHAEGDPVEVVIWFRWRAGRFTPEEAYTRLHGVEAPFASSEADAEAARAADAWQPPTIRSAVA